MSASEGVVEGGSRQIFSPRTIIAVVLVGIFAFSAFFALLAYAPDLERDVRCRANVYSKCAIGFAGLAELVREQGARTLISRTHLPAGVAEGLMIVTPEAEALNPFAGAAKAKGDQKSDDGQDTDSQDAGDKGKDDLDIAGLGFGGPVLVVLPKWEVSPDPDHFAWGRKVALLDPKAIPQKDVLDTITIGRRAGLTRPRLTGQDGAPLAGLTLTPGPIDSLQTMTAKDWTPVLTDDAGNVVMAQMPSTRIFVLSDPDLLNTQGLGNLDTLGVAAAIVRAMRTGDGPVIFDVTLDGYKTDRSALKLMFGPPFLAVTLCLAAALGLAALQTFYRFGAVKRSERAIALGKEALTDNSAQLIRLARREAKMAPRYVQLARSAAAKAVAAPRELTGQALDDFLDRLAGQRGLTDRLSTLNAEAERVTTRGGLTALAERLYRWRLEMTRERH